MADPSPTISRYINERNAVVAWASGIAKAIVVAAVVGLAGWAWRMSLKVETMSAKIDTINSSIDEIKADDDRDKFQDAKISKLSRTDAMHWRLHSWAKTQINTLRHHADVEPVDWPDLDVSPD